MARLHVEQWGHGNRVAILIHGLSSSAATWSWIAPELAAAGYRVLAPDLRGHGRSPRGSYSVAGWVDDLLESVPANPELAIGHSLGGVILLEALGRLRPARAVYEDPGWWIGSDREPVIAEFEGRKRLSAADVARANPSWPPEVVSMRLEGFARWDEACARAFITGADDRTPAGPPSQPSLVLLAENSHFVPPDRAERLASMGWDVRVIGGAGHMVHLDQPAAFLAAVLSRLD